MIQVKSLFYGGHDRELEHDPRSVRSSFERSCDVQNTIGQIWSEPLKNDSEKDFET